MAKFRLTATLTRLQVVEGRAERLDYPVGSVIEPTNAEYTAFKDVMERVDDATPLTALGPQSPSADPQAPYDPEAPAVASPSAAPVPPAAPPPATEAETTSTARRR
jgi:hypothetical protein